MVELVEAASEMESEVPAEVVEVIVDVAVQMGPEISHREMKLLQSVAKDTGADLSINDVKALTEIMETVGHDGITKDQVHTCPNKLSKAFSLVFRLLNVCLFVEFPLQAQ